MKTELSKKQIEKILRDYVAKMDKDIDPSDLIVELSYKPPTEYREEPMYSFIIRDRDTDWY